MQSDLTNKLCETCTKSINKFGIKLPNKYELPYLCGSCDKVLAVDVIEGGTNGSPFYVALLQHKVVNAKDDDNYGERAENLDFDNIYCDKKDLGCEMDTTVKSDVDPNISFNMHPNIDLKTNMKDPNNFNKFYNGNFRKEHEETLKRYNNVNSFENTNQMPNGASAEDTRRFDKHYNGNHDDEQPNSYLQSFYNLIPPTETITNTLKNSAIILGKYAVIGAVVSDTITKVRLVLETHDSLKKISNK